MVGIEKTINEMMPLAVKELIREYMYSFPIGRVFCVGDIFAYVAAYYEPIQSPVTSQQIRDWLDYQSLHQGFVTKHNTLGRAIFNTI